MVVNLSKGRVGEGNARLLGSMLITKIYLAAMSRADEKASVLAKLPQFYLFVDEFQSFADKSFADILSEARKYKLNLTMAHQYIEQMDEEVREAVFGNVGTMIAFRVGAYDAEVLEKEFAPVLPAEDLVNLGLRQIYLKLMIDSVTSQPFSASTLPPIQPQKTSYVDEIIESSRKTFARPRGEVEKQITDWHEEGRVVVSKSPPKFIPKISHIKAMPKQSEEAAPPKPVSLKEVEKKKDNQRKPDVKHLSDLRSALKSMIGDQVTSSPKPETPDHNQFQSIKQEPKKEPTPEELKKILNVS